MLVSRPNRAEISMWVTLQKRLSTNTVSASLASVSLSGRVYSSHHVQVIGTTQSHGPVPHTALAVNMTLTLMDPWIGGCGLPTISVVSVVGCPPVPNSTRTSVTNPIMRIWRVAPPLKEAEMTTPSLPLSQKLRPRSQLSQQNWLISELLLPLPARLPWRHRRKNWPPLARRPAAL